MRLPLFIASSLITCLAFSQPPAPAANKEYQAIEKKIATSDFPGVLKDAEAMVASNKTKNEEYTKMINGYNMNRDPKKKPFSYKHELAVPFYYRGIANAGLNKPEEALNDFSTAIKFDPQYGDAYSKRGDTYLKKGNSLEACKDFKKGMENKSEEAKNKYDENFCWEKGIAYFKDGKTQLNLKKYNEALVLLNQSLQIYSDSAVYACRSKVYLGLSNADSAMLDITKAMELAPNNSGYYHVRGTMNFAAGDNQAAFDDFSKCIALNPSAGAYYNRALVSEALAQQNSAMFDYNQVIRLQPENGMAYYKRGLLKETVLNDRNGACEDFFKAVELGCEEAQASTSTCKKKKQR